MLALLVCLSLLEILVLTSTPCRSVRAIIKCDSTWEKGPCRAYNDFSVSATTPKNNSQGKTFVIVSEVAISHSLPTFTLS